jgi:hypothetical protein
MEFEKKLGLEHVIIEGDDDFDCENIEWICCSMIACRVVSNLVVSFYFCDLTSQLLD